MSVITTFPFTTPANYTGINAEVSGGVGKLGLVDNPGQIFSNAFTNDTGFTYDNTMAEFTGGLVRSKDQRPANAILAATYTSSVDLSWASFSPLTGTLSGTPIISGTKLVCTGAQGVYYSNAAIGAIQNIGTMRAKYTPNYTTSPPTNVNILTLWNGSNSDDRIVLTNSPSGNNLRLTVSDSTGTSIVGTAAIGGAWAPTAGQEYEFLLTWDTSTGTFRLFIDGVLHGTITVGAYTRSTSAIRFAVGANASVYNVAEGSFADAVLYSTVLFTSGYTPGYTLTETAYLESKIDGPNFSYTGIGTVVSVDDATFTESGAPRYLVGGLYWNGSAWVASDGSYAQANDSTTLVANLGALDLGGGVLPWSVIFPSSNTQASIDDFSIEVTGQQYAAEGSLETNNAFVAREFTDFQAEESAPGSTAIKYIFVINGIEYYHNGTDWVISDGSATQANTLAEVQANVATLLSLNSNCKIKVVMTGDQTETPEIDSVTVTYDFGAIEPAAPTQCQVYGFLKDSENNPIANAVVTAQPNREIDEYVEAADRVITKIISKTTDANGFFSFNLIISDDFEVDVGADPMQYVLAITPENATTPIFKNGLDTANVAKKILFEVPNQASVNITDQIGAV